MNKGELRSHTRKNAITIISLWYHTDSAHSVQPFGCSPSVNSCSADKHVCSIQCPSSLSLFLSLCRPFSSCWCPVAAYPQMTLLAQRWSSFGQRHWLMVSACVWSWTHPSSRAARPCWKWRMPARRRWGWKRARWAWWQYGRGRTGSFSPHCLACNLGTWWLVGGRWGAPRSTPS